MKKGFTIFFAVLVSSLALAIGLAILDLTLRQLQLSEVTSQSQSAIYAADTGVECALYWDNKCLPSSVAGCACSGYDASGACISGTGFATSSTSQTPAAGHGMVCQGQDLPTLWSTPPGSLVESATAAQTTFILSSNPGPCVTVEVSKSLYTDPSSGTTYPRTTIFSFGHNTCNASAANLVERELEVNY